MKENDLRKIACSGSCHQSKLARFDNKDSRKSI